MGPRDHVVPFYDDRELIERVGDYLREAVLDGGVAVVIATAAHRAEFEARLAAAGVDVVAAAGRGAYLAFDAEENARPVHDRRAPGLWQGLGAAAAPGLTGGCQDT